MFLVWTLLGLAHADLAKFDQALEEVRSNCLIEWSLKYYRVQFAGVDWDNQPSQVTAAWKVLVDASQTIQTPAHLKGQFRQRFEALRGEMDSYIRTHNLSDLQQRCVSQCVASQFYKKQLNSPPAWGFYARDSSHAMEEVTGRCFEASYLAQEVARGFGFSDVHVEGTNVLLDYLGLISRGHAFTTHVIGGRDFVLNNNHSLPETCTFRFDANWPSHLAYTPFGEGKVAKDYSSEWHLQTETTENE